MYLVSACLAGIKCRYDGTHYEIDYVKELLNSGEAIPICPEVIAGLGIPRVSCEILIENNEKKVINKSGKDLTAKFYNAAQKCVKFVKLFDIDKAILKSKSPSCGKKNIYDGSFSGNLIKGKGITAELLAENNIKIFSEKDITE